MSVFEKVQGPQAPAEPAYSDRQFLHTPATGVVMPLLQSLVTGALLALGVITLSLLFDWRNGWKAALALFGVMPFITWMYLQWRWLLLTAEKVMQRDLNGDGVIERMEPRLVKVQVSHEKENGHLQIDLMNLPCTASQLEKLAEGLLNSLPFTEGAWCGSGKPFSVAEFRLLRSVMLARGLLRARSEKDQRQGYELTDEGKAVMQGAVRE
jgi:hypothetical protein